MSLRSRRDRKKHLAELQQRLVTFATSRDPAPILDSAAREHAIRLFHAGTKSRSVERWLAADPEEVRAVAQVFWIRRQFGAEEGDLMGTVIGPGLFLAINRDDPAAVPVELRARLEPTSFVVPLGERVEAYAGALETAGRERTSQDVPGVTGWRAVAGWRDACLRAAAALRSAMTDSRPANAIMVLQDLEASSGYRQHFRNEGEDYPFPLEWVLGTRDRVVRFSAAAVAPESGATFEEADLGWCRAGTMLAQALEAIARGDQPNEIAVPKELLLPYRGPAQEGFDRWRRDEVQPNVRGYFGFAAEAAVEAAVVASFVVPFLNAFAKKLGERVGEAVRFSWRWKKPGEQVQVVVECHKTSAVIELPTQVDGDDDEPRWALLDLDLDIIQGKTLHWDDGGKKWRIEEP